MKEPPRPPPLLGERRRARRAHRRRTPRSPNLRSSVISGGLPPPLPSNLAVRNGPIPHIQIIPRPSVEETAERRMQRTSPFTFTKPSFSEEAKANLSSYPNPYNWQANLATASDGSSFAQKARAAELNAARARRAAQMQSIDDEIPDLSGPVSLGTYKFTRRGRGNRYESLRLSELQKTQEKEKEKEKKGEKKVTRAAPISLAHRTFNPPPSTTLTSIEPSDHSAHQTDAELNGKIPNSLNNPNPNRRGINGSGPPQYDRSDSSHHILGFSKSIHSPYSNKRSSKASRQDQSSGLPAQECRSNEVSSVSINPAATSGLVRSSVPHEYHSSSQYLNTTINPDYKPSQPPSRQTDHPFRLQAHGSFQNSEPQARIDGPSPQRSRPAHASFLPLDRQPDSSQQYGQPTSSLNALAKSDGQSSRASVQASVLLSSQNIQRLTSELYPKVASKAQDLPAAQRQSNQVRPLAHRSPTPKDYALPQLSPLPDNLPTASFNLETNQWDPDLPEANMSAQTPTNKSSRGGHSGPQSSLKSSQMSYPSQDIRNPYAIVTTTKSGRPYTNPYMPIDPPPSAARPILRESSSAQTKPDNQRDDAELVERQRKTGYIDQEEARYRALEYAKYGRAEGSLDDPFQDQTTQVQHYGLNQPINYADYATHQAAYGQLPGYGRHPPSNTYTSDANASPSFSVSQQTARAPNAGPSPYHDQRSAYEQQAVVNRRAQNPGVAPPEQRPQYEQANPRASVRLPAVRGTTEQPKLCLQESSIENMSLEDQAGRDAQDQRRRHAQGGVQPASSRLSHAIPIRDPAAYTGSGLITRRNQEALRQNLDTVVASSQGPTGSARTVMNDPHRDRQPFGEPSSAVTDTTVTGSTLRAQAPSYEFVTTQWPGSMNSALTKPGLGTDQRHGKAALGESEPLPLRAHAGSSLKTSERASAGSENVYRRDSFRAPAMPSSLAHDATTLTKNAGLPASAIGAGNKFMRELVDKIPREKDSQQRLEDAATWFRTDPRDLSYAAAVLPYETMNRMNAEQFPLEARIPQTVSQLANDSQYDDLSDQARQAATPRPIGHGRPAGLSTPPSSIHGPRRGEIQPPFSTLAGVSSIHDKEAMERSGREFLQQDARTIEAMFGGVYSNLAAAKNGPYDYLSHYCPPPPYAIDHNAKNNDTLFDPQWFATAPPARVGRDPRREQGEYEDPTLGSASRRGEHARGDGIRRDSGGRAGSGSGSGSGIRGWGRS